VPNMPPRVSISAPTESQVSAGIPVSLAAVSADEEDGNLNGSIQWSSDKDGLLGSGADLTVALSEGMHVLKASSTDSDGAVGLARTTLLVGNPTAVATYSHNALGQRVVKTQSASELTMHFIYDPEGKLIVEIDVATGNTVREYVYVNGQQVALVDDTNTPNEELYFVHNDHLGTPQKITNDSRQVVRLINCFHDRNILIIFIVAIPLLLSLTACRAIVPELKSVDIRLLETNETVGGNGELVTAKGMLLVEVASNVDIYAVAKEYEFAKPWYQLQTCGSKIPLIGWSTIYPDVQSKRDDGWHPYFFLVNYKGRDPANYNLAVSIEKLCLKIGAAGMLSYSHMESGLLEFEIEPRLVESLRVYEASGGEVVLEQDGDFNFQ